MRISGLGVSHKTLRFSCGNCKSTASRATYRGDSFRCVGLFQSKNPISIGIGIYSGNLPISCRVFLTTLIDDTAAGTPAYAEA